MSDRFSFDIPDGEILSDIDLKILQKNHPVREIISLTDKNDWSNGYIVDGVDYNLTGLRVLPTSFEWDFEGSNQGWSYSGGGWAHGYDTSLGPTNGVHSGNSALYTYNGSYPNNLPVTYYATSPSIDCSSCSGNWEFKYWKRLGVESRSYDRAFVDVKNSNGAWVTVYQNPYGTVNDGSYTQSTHDVSSYIGGNSDFQVRYGLGRTDGSVTFTGWNVDDILIQPTTNIIKSSSMFTAHMFKTQRKTIRRFANEIHYFFT